jgi:hypothetical protein
VLHDELWFVPGEAFGLAGYVGPCVGYGYYIPWGVGDLSEGLRLVSLNNC